MLIFGTNQDQVDLTKEFLSSRFSIKGMREADIILVSTPMDTSEKLRPNNGLILSRYTSNPSTQHWQAAQRVLKGGAISWASKKQTCITSSTTESEFVALAADVSKLMMYSLGSNLSERVNSSATLISSADMLFIEHADKCSY
ncbi:hypothetical protein Tco_0051291 [Tanacetum coccineum]